MRQNGELNAFVVLLVAALVLLADRFRGVCGARAATNPTVNYARRQGGGRAYEPEFGLLPAEHGGGDPAILLPARCCSATAASWFSNGTDTLAANVDGVAVAGPAATGRCCSNLNVPFFTRRSAPKMRLLRI
jgi:hypothetical protein